MSIFLLLYVHFFVCKQLNMCSVYENRPSFTVSFNTNALQKVLKTHAGIDGRRNISNRMHKILVFADNTDLVTHRYSHLKDIFNVIYEAAKYLGHKKQDKVHTWLWLLEELNNLMKVKKFWAS